MRLFRFIEPHSTGGTAVITVNEATLLNHTRSLACVDKGASDESLIEEFCIVHWAWEVENDSK